MYLINDVETFTYYHINQSKTIKLKLIKKKSSLSIQFSLTFE